MLQKVFHCCSIFPANLKQLQVESSALSSSFLFWLQLALQHFRTPHVFLLGMVIKEILLIYFFSGLEDLCIESVFCQAGLWFASVVAGWSWIPEWVTESLSPALLLPCLPAENIDGHILEACLSLRSSKINVIRLNSLMYCGRRQYSLLWTNPLASVDWPLLCFWFSLFILGRGVS